MQYRPGVGASPVSDETHGALDPGLDFDIAMTLAHVIGGSAERGDQQPNEITTSDPYKKRSLQSLVEMPEAQCVNIVSRG